MSDKATTQRQLDEETIKRLKLELDKKGVKVSVDDLRDAVNAAEVKPVPEIPVSQGMINVGRAIWKNNDSAPVHVLLPLLYRAMEQQRRDEEKDKH